MRRFLGSFLAAGVAGSLVGPVGAMDTTHAPAFATTAAVCPDQVEKVSDGVGLPAECGRVEVAETLSEYATGMVDSSGDLQMTYSASAVRQDSDGDDQWAPVDVEVATEPVAEGELAGMLPVTGGVEPVWVNPGASSGVGLPLVALGTGRDRITMYSESLDVTEAPPGVVDDSGRRVTYEFGEGVDLVVSVNADGTAAMPVVRIADEAALEHLRGDLLGDSADLALDFPLTTAEGLEVRAAATGDGFDVVRGSDAEVVWSSGPALMWDSAGPTDWGGGSESGDAGAASKSSANESVETSRTASTDGAGDEEARLESPVAGDTVATMGVEVDPTATGGTVTVVPDAEMLENPDISMPLHLDPRIGAPDPTGWAMVQNYSGWKNTPHWKYKYSEGVGVCDPAFPHYSCSRKNVQRLLWRFSSLRRGSNGTWLGQLKGSEILRAEFSVFGAHSYDCDARSVDVYGVGNYIDDRTVWDNVEWWSKQDRWTGTHREGCSQRRGRAEFDVTARVRTAANDNESWISLGMRAAREDNMSWWKRYTGSSGELTILYDQPPLPPTTSQTEIVPNAGASPVDCPSAWSKRIQVRDATPQLKARGREPDGTSEVKIRFRVQSQETKKSIWYSDWSAPGGASTWRAKSVPGSVGLESGKTYRWQVQVASTDPASGHKATTKWSDSPLCFFEVDTEHPNPPKVTSTNYPERQIAGGVGTSVSVTFAANGSRDVARYWYARNRQSDALRRTPTSKGGSVTFGIPIERPGLNYIWVYSEDDAGLISDPTIYEFYVGFPFTTGHWQFNDSGWSDGTAASTGRNADDNSIAGDFSAGPGVSWTQGAVPDGSWPPDPSGDVSDRVEDGAWLFNADPAGRDDVATSVEPVVNGTESFTVSAFLRPDDTARSSAAVSQVPTTAETVDGDVRSSFHLGFSTSQSCPTETDPSTVDEDPDTETRVMPCFAFWHVRDNDPTSDNVISRTPVAATEGEWAHVVGVYDANEQTLRAWACPMFAFRAERPAAGPLASFDVDANGDGDLNDDGDENWHPWNVAGHLRLGSGMKNGTAIWPYHGAIDEVRIAAGQIYDEDTLEDICKGADVP